MKRRKGEIEWRLERRWKDKVPGTKGEGGKRRKSPERERRRLNSYFGIKNNQKNDEEIRLKKVKGLDIEGVTSGGD